MNNPDKSLPDHPSAQAGGWSPAVPEQAGGVPSNRDERSADPGKSSQSSSGDRILGGKSVIVGEVRGLQESLEPGEGKTLSFLIEQYDAAGNRMPPVSVEFKGGAFSGVLRNGNRVEVQGKWVAGTLQAASIQNLDTKAEVRKPFWSSILGRLIGGGCVLAVSVLIFYFLNRLFQNNAKKQQQQLQQQFQQTTVQEQQKLASAHQQLMLAQVKYEQAKSQFDAAQQWLKQMQQWVSDARTAGEKAQAQQQVAQAQQKVTQAQQQLGAAQQQLDAAQQLVNQMQQ